MRYAKNEYGERIEATESGQRAICAACGNVMIGRCGELRVNHWAHKPGQLCHVAKEPKTKWHYDWQDQFPKDWQEVVTQDEKGARHIADIKTKTPAALVIEFQYSFIKATEQTRRENHYKRMIWVVNGTRCSSDFERIRWRKAQGYWIGGHKQGEVLNVPDVEKSFPKSWLGRSVPVCFDFKMDGDEGCEEFQREMRDDLIVLLPKVENGIIGCLKLSRAQFIRMVKDDSLMSYFDEKRDENTMRVKKRGNRRNVFGMKQTRELGAQAYAESYALKDFGKHNGYNRRPQNWTGKERTDIIKWNLCPQCGKGNLVLREGKYGKFYGCSDYPNCRFTVRC